MTMKTQMIFSLFAALLAVNVHAATPKAKTVALKDPTAIYQAGEVQVAALAYTDTANLKDFDTGGGLAVTYWHWENVGAGFEAKTLDTAHAFFDTIGLNLAARYPLGQSGFAPFTRIGFDWNAEQVGAAKDRADFDVYVGLGREKRFRSGFALGAELRGVRAAELAPKERLQLLAFASKTF